MNAIAAIVEMDAEHDRKTCVALDLKVRGANKELAQWVANHRYPNTRIAQWLECSETRIRRLRDWAEGGFVGLPNDASNAHRRNKTSSTTNGTLKLQDNSEPSVQDSDNSHDPDAVAEPSIVEENVLNFISRTAANATAFNKIFKLSHFDPEMVTRISNAIDRMIVKWQSCRATLTRKE